MFNDEVIIRSQQRFRSDHHRVYTEEVNKIALSSNDDKRIQTFDKVTTFSYGTNVFKVCENEMLLKNKLSERDEDKSMPKDKDKTTIKTITKTEHKNKTTIKTIAKIEANTTIKTIVKNEDNTRIKTTANIEDNTTSKTQIDDNTTIKSKTKTEDNTRTKTKTKDNTTTKTRTRTKTKTKTDDNTTTKTKTKTKTEDNTTTKTKTEDKDEGIDRGRNVFIQMFHLAKKMKDKNGNWERKQIIWIFWGDGHILELCEKWVYREGNYAYTRFEDLHTHSGEVLFTREHKAVTSKGI